jgi:CheY-like chemotaxis protein
LIERVARLLESSIPKKANLRLDLAEGLPCIHADASQIQQVVMNLITNAAESLVDGYGAVDVTTGVEWVGAGQRPATERSENLASGEYVFLEVKDTGCGMDPETLNRIFDPFFTTKFTGRGLGLAAVLGIVRGHHGGIQVHSRPSEGTIFRVTFPAIAVCESDKDEQPAALEPWTGFGTVLVVEDQAPVRDLARVILERSGLTVLTAEDGRQAVEVFTEHVHEVHAVLLDLSMPGMDGAEVLQYMTGLAPDVRVVLCSGYNEQDVNARLDGLKPAGFLRKPYHPSELMERLRAVW